MIGSKHIPRTISPHTPYMGKYCFPCVSGLCPYGLDFLKDCYPKLDTELKNLALELYMLRMEVVSKQYMV